MILVLVPCGDTYTEAIMSGHGQTSEKHCQGVRVRAIWRGTRAGVQLCAVTKPVMQEVGSTT
jgi:hypothetical protein